MYTGRNLNHNQNYNEDSIPRNAPRPSIKFPEQSIIKPTVPELSVILVNPTEASKLHEQFQKDLVSRGVTASLQYENKESHQLPVVAYSSWKKDQAALNVGKSLMGFTTSKKPMTTAMILNDHCVATQSQKCYNDDEIIMKKPLPVPSFSISRIETKQNKNFANEENVDKSTITTPEIICSIEKKALEKYDQNHNDVKTDNLFQMMLDISSKLYQQQKQIDKILTKLDSDDLSQIKTILTHIKSTTQSTVDLTKFPKANTIQRSTNPDVVGESINTTSVLNNPTIATSTVAEKYVSEKMCYVSCDVIKKQSEKLDLLQKQIEQLLIHSKMNKNTSTTRGDDDDTENRETEENEKEEICSCTCNNKKKQFSTENKEESDNNVSQLLCLTGQITRNSNTKGEKQRIKNSDDKFGCMNANKAEPSSERSLIMNELAMKYLSNDKLQNFTQYHHHLYYEVNPNSHIPLRNPSVRETTSEVSFATYRYLCKHGIIPQSIETLEKLKEFKMNNTNNKIDIEHRRQHQSLELLQKINYHKDCRDKQGQLNNSDKAENILDVAAIKRQTKFT